MKERLCPQRPFPPYAFLPGKNPHPLKEGGHSFSQGEPELNRINENSPYESEDFLFSLDLFNHGFYWETHMYLEALWNAHNRQGNASHLFLAIIKLSAAGIKWKLAQTSAAEGHLKRALEHLDHITSRKVLGFDIHDIKILIEKFSFNSTSQEAIVFDFDLIPKKN